MVFFRVSDDRLMGSLLPLSFTGVFSPIVSVAKRRKVWWKTGRESFRSWVRVDGSWHRARTKPRLMPARRPSGFGANTNPSIIMNRFTSLSSETKPRRSSIRAASRRRDFHCLNGLSFCDILMLFPGGTDILNQVCFLLIQAG